MDPEFTAEEIANIYTKIQSLYKNAIDQKDVNCIKNIGDLLNWFESSIGNEKELINVCLYYEEHYG